MKQGDIRLVHDHRESKYRLIVKDSPVDGAHPMILPKAEFSEEHIIDIILDYLGLKREDYTAEKCQERQLKAAADYKSEMQRK